MTLASEDTEKTLLEPDAGLRGFWQLCHAVLRWVYITSVPYVLFTSLFTLSSTDLDKTSTKRKTYVSSWLDGFESKLDVMLPALNDNDKFARLDDVGQRDTWNRLLSLMSTLRHRIRLHVALCFIIAKAYVLQLLTLVSEEMTLKKELMSPEKNFITKNNVLLYVVVAAEIIASRLAISVIHAVSLIYMRSFTLVQALALRIGARCSTLSRNAVSSLQDLVQLLVVRDA